MSEKNHPANRRKQKQIDRSKAWLAEAMVKLLRTHELSEISISQLCRTAGVGRQTYYRHFASKLDVIDYIFNQINELMLEAGFKAYRENPGTEAFEVEAMKILRQHREIALLGHKKDIYPLTTERFEEARKFIESSTNFFEDEDPYQYEFRAGAISRVLFAWIENGMVESPESMAKIFRPLYRR